MIYILILFILVLSLIFLFVSKYDIIVQYEVFTTSLSLGRPGYGFSENQYSYQYLNKLDYSLKIMNRYHIDEAVQGIIVSGTYFYAISNRIIAKYYKHNAVYIKSLLTYFNHFNGGISYNGNIYLTNNPTNGPNSVQIFDINLNHIYSIDIPPFYPKDGFYGFDEDLYGSLTWIDQYNGYWWGCFAFYKKKIYKTRVVRFEEDWTVEKSWMLPVEILDRLKPWSISGGQFHKKSGLLFLTGHDKKEIYITRIIDDITIEVLDLVSIIPTPFEGQGISFDSSNTGSDYLWGIKRSSQEVIISRLEYI